jgi:hypothetical protein
LVLKNLIKKILKENYALTDDWGSRRYNYNIDINLDGIDLILEDSNGLRLLPKNSKVFRKDELTHIKNSLSERGISGWYKIRKVRERWVGDDDVTDSIELKFNHLNAVKVFLEMKPVDLSNL